MRIFLIAAVLAAMAPAASASASASSAPVPADGEAQLARLTAGRVAGSPVPCARIKPMSDQRIADGTAVVYRAGPLLYVNRFGGACPQLRSQLVVARRIGQVRLCRGKIMRVLEPVSGKQIATCTFGDFTPFARVP